MPETDAASTETELKLHLPAGAFAALAEGEFRKASVQELVSIYFDTDDRRLQKARLGVRLRSTDGGGWVQTVKGESLGLDRFEDEAEVATGALDRARLERGPIARILGDAALQPVFETRVRRRTKRVQARGAEIELALDEGEVVAGAARQPFRELELELKAGARSALFPEARRFVESAVAAVSLVSKAERGHTLAAGREARAVRFRPPTLQAGMNAGDAFRALAFAAVHQLQANVLSPGAENSLETVHQARVALRRLRATLSAFKAVVDDDRLSAVKAQLKQMGDVFADARSLDVFIAETFRPFARSVPGVAALGLGLLKVQGEAHARARAAASAKDFRMGVLDLLEWISIGPWTEEALTRAKAERPIAEAAPRLLEQRWKKLRRRGRALDWRDPLARHALRIEAKKMRYIAEAFTPLCGDASDFLAALKAFQDFAGQLNDIAVAEETAALVLGPSLTAEAAFAAGLMVGERRAGEAQLRRKARKALAALESEPPFWKG